MSERDENLRTAYQELCSSYRTIDDFRMKLLGLLPLASGTGIFLLLDAELPEGLLPPIGLFGFVVTLGLFVYEIRGIQKCLGLIETGKQIEGLMCVRGQFAQLPPEPAGFIGKPLAAFLIYPAVLAAWLFLAATPFGSYLARWLAGLVLVGGLGLFGLGKLNKSLRPD